MHQEELRKKLKYILLELGVKARHISEKTGVLEVTISRFKNGKYNLCISEYKSLKAYLDTFNSMLSM